jgi:hypothetical protein
MIGFLFLTIYGLWIAAAVWLSKRIPRWVGMTKHTTVASVLMFPLVLTAPVADDLIGRWQFYRLCDKEAVVTLSPDWEKVKAARDNDEPTTSLEGYAIPIRVQRVEFVDANTRQPFLTYKGFHTKGGFLMRHGLGLGGTTSCWPKDKTQLLNKVNIDQLLKQGK